MKNYKFIVYSTTMADGVFRDTRSVGGLGVFAENYEEAALRVLDMVDEGNFTKNLNYIDTESTKLIIIPVNPPLEKGV